MKAAEGEHLQAQEEHLYLLSLDCSALLYTSVLLEYWIAAMGLMVGTSRIYLSSVEQS